MDSGFSANRLPFYSLPSSQIFDNEVSVSEALELAGLNFTVGKRPCFDQKDDGSFAEVPGKFVTYRTDTEAALGVVGNVYTPFQNEPALSLCDELLDHGALIEAAGTWNGGSDVMISAKLPEGIIVPGEEALDLHLLFRNNHSGSGAVSAYITPVRLLCNNMLSSALKSAVQSWKVRHTNTVSERIHEAAAALNLVNQYKLEYEATIQKLQETEISADEFDGFLKEWTDAERVRQNVRDVYNSSPTVTQGNRWGVWNALTETLDHFPARQTRPESRFASSLDGPLARSRDRAMRLLTR